MTTEQLELDFDAPPDEKRASYLKRLLAFRRFHAANPRVWSLFESFAIEAARAGARKIGARLIWERLRWEVAVVTRSDEFKLNDHHPPFYARLFVRRHPEHDDLFELREQKGSD